MSGRCSDTARLRGDPIGATAAPARRWLLVEHPGPWQVDAFAGSGIAPPVLSALAAAARAAQARPLLVRRPGRQAPAGPRSWAVADAGTGAVQWGRWASDTDLLGAVDALTSGPLPGSSREPLLLVCAHGRHDTCCAVRGRPVATALARRWPDATWECSHVGGDRFAPNLLVLPDGACYGNLDTADAVGLVDGHLAGTLQLAWLRGLSTQQPVVQAAVIAAHGRHGPGGPRDVTSTRVEQVDAHEWRVHLAGREPMPETMVATVERHRREPALLTCRAAEESAAWTFRVRDLE